MSDNVIDGAHYFLDGKRLRRVKSAKFSDESSREAVIPSGATRAEGSTLKPGAEMITVDCWPTVDPEVDWNDLKKRGTIKVWTTQYQAGNEKGPRRQCKIQVSKVNEPEGENGDFTYTVELLVIGEIKTVARTI